MPEPTNKVQRWLDLITYLVGRRFPVPVDELMERLPAYARDWRGENETARASVRRKFERDESELRELGIPLQTVTYSINYGMEEAQGYRISKRDFYQPAGGDDLLLEISGDRVLSAEPTGERFSVPEDFDPEAHVQGGRIFRADRKMDVTVRYYPAVGPWVAEKEVGQTSSDGSLRVACQVADPRWIVRHVLQYGPKAEVLEPEEVSGWVRGEIRFSLN